LTIAATFALQIHLLPPYNIVHRQHLGLQHQLPHKSRC
jgi:hypothetical protein